jgi:hypothetical protein
VLYDTDAGGGMAHFEATVRVLDLEEQDVLLARRHIEERLHAAGFSRWQIVGLGVQGTLTRPVRVRRRSTRPDATYIGGGLMVTAVVAWALWFLWMLAG